MDLVTVLASKSEARRLAMAEHPSWSVVPSVIGLLSCSVPTQIKANLMLFLAAIAKTSDISTLCGRLWRPLVSLEAKDPVWLVNWRRLRPDRKSFHSPKHS